MSAMSGDSGGAVRAFVGVSPPAAVTEALTRRLTAWREAPGAERVAWVSPAHFHMTLAFFGELDGPDLGEAQRVLREIAPTLSPAAVSLGGCVMLPSPARPRVFVATVTDPTGRLAAMRASLVRAYAPLGYRPDHPVFRPHVTLGRARAGAPASTWTPPADVAAPAVWTVDRVSLFVGVREGGELRYQVVDTRVTGRASG